MAPGPDVRICAGRLSRHRDRRAASGKLPEAITLVFFKVGFKCLVTVSECWTEYARLAASPTGGDLITFTSGCRCAVARGEGGGGWRGGQLEEIKGERTSDLCLAVS